MTIVQVQIQVQPLARACSALCKQKVFVESWISCSWNCGGMNGMHERASSKFSTSSQRIKIVHVFKLLKPICGDQVSCKRPDKEQDHLALVRTI